MTYIKIYKAICSRAKTLDRVKSKDTYYERHHITPKSLGGLDNKDNLVLLTAKEHYIVHFLLWKHYKQKNMKNEMHKMAKAFNAMCVNKNGKNYTSKTFEIARKAFGSYMASKPGFFKGKNHSDETKRKISEAGKGRVPPNKGKPMSASAKKKMIESKKGGIPWNKGLKGEKIKCDHCDAEMARSNLTRYHNDNCKYKYNKIGVQS